MTDIIDPAADSNGTRPTLLDHLAGTAHPDWAPMIDRHRPTTSPDGALTGVDQVRAAKWGRRGGTFHKDIGGGGDEFFKK
jgi:hypothetical protein